MVPLATPVRRDVERTEQPSTSAEITATCLSLLSLFMMAQAYQTALACQAESLSYFAAFFFLPQRFSAANLPISLRSAEVRSAIRAFPPVRPPLRPIAAI